MRPQTFVHPSLFKSDVQRAPQKIFICGPGIGSRGFDLRDKIKSYVESFSNCEVIFGEDVSSKKISVKRADLQTLETQLAQSVDFTVLLLQSPGAIAELGTFSMIPSIRSRLFVLVPTEFYGAESYISRGPLSLIAQEFKRNVIYFDNDVDERIYSNLSFLITMYKYAYAQGRYQYDYHAHAAWREDNYNQLDYETYFQPIRDNFFEVVLLMAIVILDGPTFSELVSATQMHPDEVSSGLARLFSDSRIAKIRNRYRSANSYSDVSLAQVNTMQLSRARASLIAIS